MAGRGRPSRKRPAPNGRLDIYELGRLRRDGERLVCHYCLAPKDKYRDIEVSAPCELCDRVAAHAVLVKGWGYRKIAHLHGCSPSSVQYFWKRWRHLLIEDGAKGKADEHPLDINPRHR